ncbi:Predicted gamma-butyrobetaine,2-oxoglutarate dioxygenase [Ceraceosorus bombacis]|uniref:trimethyllysine dioxygenase n=1 Tax=Ceraceosorus bombacis TaxID=401625 RepID=A0A0P1BNT4_9BASI|nr:Predicted gamma-butyrobetaine,2-oxoglutarate dioxygenase [Ceraceosorus bombacis]
MPVVTRAPSRPCQINRRPFSSSSILQNASSWGNDLGAIKPSPVRREPDNATSAQSNTSSSSIPFLSSTLSTSPAPSASSSLQTPTVSFASNQTSVTWSSGVTSRFHHLWLRDHCRCATCYHPKTKQRLLDTFAIPQDVKPLFVESTMEGLLVTWPGLDGPVSSGASSQGADTTNEHGASDGSVPSTTTETTSTGIEHQSLYPWSWLRANSYAPVLSSNMSSLDGAGDVQSNDLGMERRGKVLWGRGIASNPPTVQHQELASERGVAKWLGKLDAYGFCFIAGVPVTPEATQELIEKIAFIRPTHYGGFWDFTSNLAHGDTAYTSIALGAHTDTTYFTDPCGLQLFHLLEHSASEDGTPAKGGESLLVDGFLAAKVLRDVHPEAYRILSETRISTHSAGDEDTFIRPMHPRGYPILEHDDRTGELLLVRQNNDDRSTLKLREEEVMPFYDALRKWNEILTSTDGEYWQQLVPGTALSIANQRVLHGRSAFTGKRRMCGAYLAQDDVRSRTDVLLRRYPDVVHDGPRVPFAPSGEAQGGRFARGVWDDGL